MIDIILIFKGIGLKMPNNRKWTASVYISENIWFPSSQAGNVRHVQTNCRVESQIKLSISEKIIKKSRGQSERFNTSGTGLPEGEQREGKESYQSNHLRTFLKTETHQTPPWRGMGVLHDEWKDPYTKTYHHKNWDQTYRDGPECSLREKEHQPGTPKELPRIKNKNKKQYPMW